MRYSAHGVTGFGALEGDIVSEYSGDMFDAPKATGRKLALSDVQVLPPSEPTKVIALWNNFHALAAKLNVAEPPDPLYLMKANTSIAASGATIPRPASYSGRVVYEGELGIVIGQRCTNASEQEAANAVFGYTCVNDVTAADIISKDPTFAQWVRAKSFDGFGPFGPVIATGLDSSKLVVRTILNGQERQNYPIADMIFSSAQLVSRISHDMTLLPGDLICCGTSLGVGAMKDASNAIEVAIDGIGTLRNQFTQ
jgi:2-keto-4-pentenoate hydratase/2-oxohepta-3-ene-1,7-dioic acid hydratase in catechol pathway